MRSESMRAALLALSEPMVMILVGASLSLIARSLRVRLLA
jgi:hypothetical protein